METQRASLEIFCSYSEVDAPLLEQLERHLSALQCDGLIFIWHRRRIEAGSVRQEELDRHLNAATLILLLVSSDYLAAQYCYREMQWALQRHQSKEAQVIPILLRPCDWENTPLASLEMLPTGAQSITSWSNQDEAWTNVVKGIRRVLGGKTGTEGYHISGARGGKGEIRNKNHTGLFGP